MPAERSETEAPPVELIDVTVINGSYQILDQVNIVFPADSCSVIMGTAGSGKSTLLKVAAGLTIPTHGKVLVAGRDLYHFTSRQEQDYQADSGFVFQDSALWQDPSILDNVAMPLYINQPGKEKKEIYGLVSSCLRRLGYDEEVNVRPVDLSIGEQKLVSIARGIIHEPSIIFMDDPTGNLDDDATEHLFEVLGSLKTRKATIVITTNNTDLAYKFADYLGVIKNGKLLAFGCYDECLAKAEMLLSGSLARLKSRGQRACAPTDASEENTGRSEL